MNSKILRIKFSEALDIVRATASDFPQRILTVGGMRSMCTMPIDESLLKVVKKYGEKILLKESDKKPKASKKKGKRRSPGKENQLENLDGWRGPPPWDLSLGSDGCPKFLCDVMVSTLSYLCR